MSRKPLYIELLAYIDDKQEGAGWVNVADVYREKLANEKFYNEFKEEINFLAENQDILIKGNLAGNPNHRDLELQAQITVTGEDYLRSYKIAKLEDKDKYTSSQIVMLMFGIVAGTVALAYGLAYFFG